MAPQLIFLGTPSTDRIARSGVVHDSIGGAAFLSALAARWTGATVGLVARVPTRLPDAIAVVFGPGGLDRRGLRTVDAPLPSFHISYDAEDRATYTHVDNGAEAGLSIHDLPTAWLGAAHIHLAAIGPTATAQLEAVDTLRSQGHTGPISAGTYPGMLQSDLPGTRRLLVSVDLFFCNAEELRALCPDGPPPDTRVCVTDGPRGVTVHHAGSAHHFATTPATVVDATGAGDAFCGGYLAGIALGLDPVKAGQAAATHVLSGPGAQPFLLDLAPRVRPRARPVPERISAVAAQLREQARSSAFDFTTPPHLPAGHPMALAMLCTSTLHQFGFWEADAEQGWRTPMYATLDGVRRKGSDFIWAAFARAARQDPSLYDPSRMAREPGLFEQICTDDDGRCPLPQPGVYARLHQAHAQHLTEHWPGGWPALLADCNAHPQPVARLLHHLSQMPGYCEDPLGKKASLLAIILKNRPEKFLHARDPDSIRPVVDYHLMRTALRTGCVDLLDPDLERRCRARLWMDGPEEGAIRQASYEAIAALVQESGLDIAAVDAYFFSLGRRTCLEVEPARCDTCSLTACAQLADRFQPVFRTTSY